MEGQARAQATDQPRHRGMGEATRNPPSLIHILVKNVALERKVGQLTMELDLVKKTPRLRLVSDNENFSTVTGPKPAPFDGGGCWNAGLTKSPSSLTLLTPTAMEKETVSATPS